MLLAGTEVRKLLSSEVKQIAGRAGRFGTAHPTGHVTCLHQSDVPLLHEAMGEASVPLQQARIMPRLGRATEGNTLSHLIV